MNKIIMAMMLVGACTGCTTAQQQPSTTLGLANPASTFCVEQGGRLELRNEANGQVGYCHLPDGQVLEEWTYFRSQQAQCIAEQATQLVGQKLLTEEELKAKTQAAQIRVLMPKQPATMDFRADRLTLMVDPETTTIQHASCG